MELFRAEAESQTSVLSTGLLHLEGDEATPATIEPMMRAAHSLKGAAQIVGLKAGVQVAHVMEDVLVAAQKGQLQLSPAHIDTLLRGVDFLTEISQAPEAEALSWHEIHAEDVNALVAQIGAVLNGEPPESTPPPVGPTAAPVDDLSSFSLMDLFRSEAESQTAILSAGLLTLEADEASGPTIEPMMRAAHSLKGAARIVGLDTAVRVAHVMEDVLVAAQKGKLRLQPSHVDTLLRGVDFLSQLAQISEADAPSWQAAQESLVESLVAAIASLLSGETVLFTESASIEPIPPAPVQEVPKDAPPVPPAKPAEIAPARAATEEADRVVRVTAESLTRLLALAGESLVQARQLRPFVDSLLALRSSQAGLWENMQRLEDRLSHGAESDRAALLDLVTKAKRQAQQGMQTLGEKAESIEDFARRSEDLSGRLHHEVITCRMRPLADGIRGFPRLVRDVARQLGKTVQFEILGEATGVDRDILERLEAPLNHLIRNALDHGLEGPEERLAAGKPEMGSIRLEARHRAGMLHITLTDDGRGIDPKRLRAKVVERNLTSKAMAEQLTEAELLEFLFLPGFSTRDAVTDLSGRGVGLDVVQSMVQAVAGSVRVSSQLGKGTVFSLLLPITRSLVRALLVRIADEPYAFPLSRIDRILMVDPETIQMIEGRQHLLIEEQPVALVAGSQILELSDGPKHGSALPVVVVGDRGQRFGVAVEEFLGERDLEVRPLDSRLGKVADVSSASVLENGWPVLIIDVEDLVRSIDNLLGRRRLKRIGVQDGAGEPLKIAKRILVVDDSITVRELERQLLESRGYHVDLAVDGLDGWNAVRGNRYDLIVSDVDMPRMDGIQLVRSIKQDPRLKSIPVVIISYKDREEDRIRGLDAGANSYLTKSSFHDQTFLDTIVDLIGEASE
jgi:two-component system, chemotaxis family, sensor histidine kinase and response regulator WspE